MASPVPIHEIIEAMQLQSDDVFSYVNTQTGEVVTVTSAELNAVEDGGNADGLDESMLSTARAVVAGAPYIPLPDRFEIHEYAIMENFAESLADEHDSAILRSSLHGSGAFRRFKDTAHRLGLIENWYRFLDEAYEKIAVKWCEVNGVAFRRE